MRLSEKDRGLMLDIRKHALEAKALVAGLNEAAYLKQSVVKRAAERIIEIIGEACRQVSQEGRESFPQIPFSSIVSMRHLLAHGYNSVDHKEIWVVLKKSIPELLQALDTGPDFS